MPPQNFKEDIKMAHKIKLGNDLEVFEIEFEGRNSTVEIEFNPNDPDLSKRLMEAQKIINEKSKGIKQFEVDENGMPNADSCVQYLNEMNQVVYDAVDYAFGNKISDKVFKYCSPYGIVNGEYFVLHFFNRMIPELKKIISSSQKKANENMNKHLAKYMKKQ